MSKDAKVVILMLTYNHEDCVEQAISSLLKQDYRNIELRVIDDCSQDSTFEVLKLMDLNDSRVIIHRNNSNLGMFQNLLTNLREIEDSGNYEFFAWVGPDDKWETSWLSKCVRTLVSNNEIAITQSYVRYESKYKTEIRKYQEISGSHLRYLDSSILRSGYGELMHGVWRRSTVQAILSDTKTLPIELMLKLENMFVALLISKGGFSVVPEVLHTKNKEIGSKFRYKDDKFFQNPGAIFFQVLGALSKVLLLSQRNLRTRGFLLGSWLIDLRVSLPVKVKSNV